MWSHVVMSRVMEVELQKRLPGDLVTGSIILLTTTSPQLEGSEVIVPSPALQQTERPMLLASVSQDSCVSMNDDHTPLITLHTNTMHAPADDVIPVSIATDMAPPNLQLGRQTSEPLLPDEIRKVLYGFQGGHAPFSRHHSLYTRQQTQESPHHENRRLPQSEWGEGRELTFALIRVDLCPH